MNRSHPVATVIGMAVTVDMTKQAAEILRGEVPESSRVFLFGSCARHAAHADSDLDILVVEPEVADHHRESVRLRRTLQPLKTPADVIVVSDEDVDSWGSIEGTFLNNALSEGKLLFER